MAGYEQFIEYCRTLKPPYECPVPSCGKVYRSFPGIQTHMNTYDHENMPATPISTPGSNRKKGQKRSASPIMGQLITAGESDNPPVPFSTDMKNIEFVLDGKPMKISVYDPIEVISKEEYEASLPPVIEDTAVPEVAKTPASHKPASTKSSAIKNQKSRPTAKAAERGCDIQKYTIEDKKSKALPEASFTIIEDYYKTLPDAPPVSEEYYKFVERSQSEMAADIEYDLDEEDCAWLELMNEHRAEEEMEGVPLEHLQLLMDRLEKESFFQAESTGRNDTTQAPIDEDAVCCICMDGECQNSNVILFCDMCNLPVHQECYGVPYIPEGQWLCRRCLQSPSRAVDCALCPNKGGAFKQTDDSRWAHVVCAMWIPEVCFANTVFLEPIDSIGNIPAARWKLTCYICKQRSVGACIQCNKANCYTAFHVTCAQQASLHMKIDAIRETSVAGTSVTVRKAAYCDMHTPHDADTSDVCEAGSASKRAAEAKAAWRQKMKKARKILAEKRSAAPLVSLPTIPPDKVQELAKLIDNISGVSQFMPRLLAFWTLKRQSRNGVALLRRLTNAHSSRRHNNSGSHNSSGVMSPTRSIKSPNPKNSPRKKGASVDDAEKKNKKRDLAEDSSQSSGPPKKKRKVLQNVSDDNNSRPSSRLNNSRPSSRTNNSRPPSRCISPFNNMDALVAEIQYWQRLRQDLEKGRLLCEQIRKREKQKREFVETCFQLRKAQLAPLMCLQERTIQLLEEKDTLEIFSEPVDLKEVKDYSDIVTHPMDLRTMMEKTRKLKYKTMDDLQKDFDLMISNCLAYNAKDTIFYKAALKLRDQGGMIFSQTKHMVEVTGFDSDTGLLLPQRPKPPPVKTDAMLAEEVDSYLSKLSSDRLGDETQLRKLLDVAYLINFHILRNSKVRAIRRQLSRVIEDETDEGSQTAGETNSAAESSADTDLDEPSASDSKGKEEKVQSDVEVKEKEITEEKEELPSETVEPESPMEESTDDDFVPLKDSPVIKAGSRGRGRGRGRTRGRGAVTVQSGMDNRQKKIDSFFTKKTQSDVTKDALPDDSQSQEVTKTNESLPTVSDDFAKESEGVDEEPSLPKKKGRPFKRGGASGRTGGVKAPTIEESSPPVVVEAPPPPPSEEISSSSSSTENKTTANDSGVVDVSDSVISSSDKSQENVIHEEQKLLSTETELSAFEKEQEKQQSVILGQFKSIVQLQEGKLPPSKDSFQVYRSGGGERTTETDDDTHSESTTSQSDSDEETCSDSDSDQDNDGRRHITRGGGGETEIAMGGGDDSNSHQEIQLEPLDLVWAKCRGYPWYPALIINPKMPRTGYFHNHVPIPVPPQEVLDLAHTCPLTHQFLVLFFDSKRTWQWLPRGKLDPLGESPELDKAKLVESRKPTDRKAVKKAYEQAILHRCRVTGDHEGLTGDSEEDAGYEGALVEGGEKMGEEGGDSTPKETVVETQNNEPDDSQKAEEK